MCLLSLLVYGYSMSAMSLFVSTSQFCFFSYSLAFTSSVWSEEASQHPKPWFSAASHRFQQWTRKKVAHEGFGCTFMKGYLGFTTRIRSNQLLVVAGGRIALLTSFSIGSRTGYLGSLQLLILWVSHIGVHYFLTNACDHTSLCTLLCHQWIAWRHLKKTHNANLQTKVSNIVVMWDNSDGGNGREKRCDHNLKAEKQQWEKNSFAECWILKLKRLYSLTFILWKKSIISMYWTYFVLTFLNIWKLCQIRKSSLTCWVSWYCSVVAAHLWFLEDNM